MIFGIYGLIINNNINNLTSKAMIWLSIIVCAIAFAFFESKNSKDSK